MNDARTNWKAAISGWVLLGIAALLVVFGLARCPVAMLLHQPCPGCGSTRSIGALAHGDVHGFLRYNPTALFTVTALVIAAISTLHPSKNSARNERIAVTVIAVVACVQFAVWLARFGGFAGGPVPVDGL